MGSGKKEPPPPEKKPIQSESAPVQYAVAQQRYTPAQADQAAQNDSLQLLQAEDEAKTKNLLG